MNTGDILYHVTIAGKAEELVETIHGQVTYRDWLISERERIRRKSRWPVDIWTNPTTGEISLVHLRVRR
jgi:hypothetical protein